MFVVSCDLKQKIKPLSAIVNETEKMNEGRLGFRSVGEYPDDEIPIDESPYHIPDEFRDVLEDEQPKPTKMFWHPCRIEKVQELVPEQVR